MNWQPMSLISRAQQIQLGSDGYSYDFSSQAEPERALGVYDGLGTIEGPYDLSLTGAVAEVKRALRELAKHDAPLDVIALGLADTDLWTPATTAALAARISRTRSSMPWALGPPFFQSGYYPSAPQPSVNGLEMLAGAVNESLGKNSGYELARYEAWRGGTFAPPSVVSRPPSDTPVTGTYNFDPATYVPSDASENTKKAVAVMDTLSDGFLAALLVATDETTRARLQASYLQAQNDRDSAARNAIGSSEASQRASEDCVGAGGVWSVMTQTCAVGPQGTPSPTAPASKSLVVPLLLLGGAGAAVWYFMKSKKR